MIYWGVLLERGIYDQAASALMRVAYRAGVQRFPQIHVPHTATEWAREEFTRAFLELSKDAYDTLVMLDADHEHPYNIVERLALEPPPNYGVIAALAFCRGNDSRPAYYMKDGEDPDHWYSQIEIPQGEIIPVDMAGTGAIAIRRWVFEELGTPPYWKKVYEVERGGEDWHFALECQKAGIQQYVHTGVETPHFYLRTKTRKDWEEFINHDYLSECDP